MLAFYRKIATLLGWEESSKLLSTFLTIGEVGKITHESDEQQELREDKEGYYYDYCFCIEREFSYNISKEYW